VNFEKVVFAFFIVLALTLNFGFFIGAIDDPSHHDGLELAAALAVSLIATIMKFGDRSQIGSVLLATSLVADLQLLIAAFTWGYAAYATDVGVTSDILASIVSLSGGALLANLVSVVLLVAETITIRR
jgi:Ca2+/H+ antiporter, TMEM165/GDT1 family